MFIWVRSYFAVPAADPRPLGKFTIIGLSLKIMGKSPSVVPPSVQSTHKLLGGDVNELADKHLYRLLIVYV